MISYIENQKKFNFRVGGIIVSDDGKRVLLHRKENYNFWMLPGGRVEMLEGTEDATVREIKEELGITTGIDRLISITESFFKLEDITYHELAFNYLLRLPQNCKLAQEQEEFCGIEGTEYRYKWFDRKELDNVQVRPYYLIPILKELPQELVHITRDERVVKEKSRENDMEI